MNLCPTSQAYVDRIIDANGRPKILLLDNDTTAILSLATTQSTLLKNDVFLIEKIANVNRQRMRHMDCVVFVRPSSESIAYLVDELSTPKYGQYTLIFTNIVRKSQLERLAEADDHEVIVRVQEMFLDWRKINNDVFSCELGQIWQIPGKTWEIESLEKSVDSVFSILASLRWSQPAIRYDSNSPLSKKFASQLSQQMEQHASVLPQSSSHGSKPIVLILDRLNDPIAPLVSHWTYQAMVDELLGINNNRVNLSAAPDVPKSHQEIVLAQDQDAFFNDSMYLNFGDLGAAVREYVGQYSIKSKSSQQLETVADIKKFVDGLPEFRKLQDNTTKHVSLVGELSRLVADQHLLAVSEVEQSLACNENHASDLEQVQQLLVSGINAERLYRIVALYGLRYRNHPHQSTEQLLQTLVANHGSCGDLDKAVRTLIQIYNTSAYPQEDIFSQGSIFMRAQQGLKGLRGVENVYTQHKVLLESVLAQLMKNRLPREQYPLIKQVPMQEAEPNNVLVFIVGGATFDEARIVGEVNRSSTKQQILLGATEMINPSRFLNSFKGYNL